MVGLLLFTQAIAIVEACVAPESQPSMAFSEAKGHSGCEGESGVNANACLQHCTSGSQSTVQFPVAMIERPTLAVLSVPVAPYADPVQPQSATCNQPSTDPPPSIRFCSFQL